MELETPGGTRELRGGIHALFKHNEKSKSEHRDGSGQSTGVPLLNTMNTETWNSTLELETPGGTRELRGGIHALSIASPSF